MPDENMLWGFPIRPPLPVHLPEPKIENWEGILVVRDDLIPGGTKQRVLERWLPELGPAEYVYAGPREGYAQIALARACAALGEGYSATLFVPQSNPPHKRTLRAMDCGAEVHVVAPGYLSQVRSEARLYCIPRPNTRLIPFGMNDPEFINHMVQIARAIPIDPPPEFWVAAGSGTLCRALQQAWPRAAGHAIQVGHKVDLPLIKVLEAPEAFAQPARYPPPFPSCPNYDAKVWRFVQELAKPGALFWNVAA